MRNGIISIILAGFLLIIGCQKSADNANSDCGCNTDSLKYTMINQEGLFGYDSLRKGWVITVEFPTDDFYQCKVCNPNLSSIAAIIDTLSKTNNLSIIFSGKLIKPCLDEIDFNYLPENQQFDIIVVSLKKK